MVDWQQIAIDFVLGIVALRDLPAIADGDLRSPDQPEALFELAFSEGCEDRVIERNFRSLLKQLHLSLPNESSAVQTTLREVAKRVVRRELDPQAALDKLYELLKSRVFEITELRELLIDSELINDGEVRYRNVMFERFRSISEAAPAE